MSKMTQVLVVDDDQPIRDALRYLLEDAGQTVIECADGVTALAALRETMTPMVAILDLMMPKMTGSQLLRTIAQDSALSARHAYILLTANTHLVWPTLDGLPQDFATTLTFLQKPFQSDLLLFMVEHVGQRLAARS